MKKIGFVLFFMLLTMNCGPWTNSYAQETLTILTYYPAPYGVYQNLKTTQQVWIGTDVDGNPLSGGTPLLQVGGTQEFFEEEVAIYAVYASSSMDNATVIYANASSTTGSPTGICGRSISPSGIGVYGVITTAAGGGTAILGWNDSTSGNCIGVEGQIRSTTDGSSAVYGLANGATGLTYAVYGYNISTTANSCGVRGVGNYGVYGYGTSLGVYGKSSDTCVQGGTPGEASNVGVYGFGNVQGVYGHTITPTAHAVEGFNAGGGYAGYFTGNLYASGNVGIGIDPPTAKLHVNGNIKAVLNDVVKHGPIYYDQVAGSSTYNQIGYDMAELFNTNSEVEPGDVLIIDSNGKLNKCDRPNDIKVAGIVSNSPAILFEGSELQIAPEPFKFQKGTKPPMTLAGRILAKVTTENGSIEPGDLLTTSSTPGHAMKAKPIGELNGYPIYLQGCIIGKALEPLKEGKGKILVLVCLM